MRFSQIHFLTNLTQLKTAVGPTHASFGARTSSESSCWYSSYYYLIFILFFSFIWREDLERELALVFLPCGCGCVVLLNGCVFSCLRVRVCEFVCCTCLVMVLRHIVQATCACIRKLNGISRHDCMMIVLLLFLQKQSFSRSHVMIIYLRHLNECSLYVGNKQQPLKPF